MVRVKNWFSSDSSRGLTLIGLPFGFSLLLLAAPMLLIIFWVSGLRIISFLTAVLVRIITLKHGQSLYIEI